MKNVFIKFLTAGVFSAGVCTSGFVAAAEKDDFEPHIKLESTIVGDKEQPAVSYFIPWQGTSTPDKLQWDMEPKHDATLKLIDRDVMLRSMEIYDDMNMEKN